jgi:hypothetical protein
MSVMTSTSVLSVARSLTADTALSTVVKAVDALDRRAASGSHAYSTLLVHTADTLGLKPALEAFGLTSSGGVTNHRNSVKAWEGSGLSDVSIDRLVTVPEGKRPVAVWTLVSSPNYLRDVWSTDAGKALVTALAAAEDDDARIVLLLGALTPSEPKTPTTPEAALIAALTRADAIVGSEAGVSLDDEQRAIVLDLLASITAGVVVPVEIAEPVAV